MDEILGNMREARDDLDVPKGAKRDMDQKLELMKEVT